VIQYFSLFSSLHNAQVLGLSTHLHSDVKALVLVGLRGQDVVLRPPFHLWPQVPYSIVDDVARLWGEEALLWDANMLALQQAASWTCNQAFPTDSSHSQDSLRSTFRQ
jgi:hypothetical protein